MNERQHDVLCKVSAQGVATLTLNRVEKHNAFDGVMIAHLLVELERLSADPSVRVLVSASQRSAFFRRCRSVVDAFNGWAVERAQLSRRVRARATDANAR